MTTHDALEPGRSRAEHGPGGRSEPRQLPTLASARLAGVLYLLIITLGIFAEVVVRARLTVRDDPQETAANILSSEWLFRLGFAADLVVFVCDVALAIVLYFLFRSVSRTLSTLAAAFRLTQTAVIALNLLAMFAALLVLTDPGYRRAFERAQAEALALLYLDIHRYGYTLGLTFFGVSTVIVGYLLLKSGLAPRALGVLLVLAGVGYVADSAAFFLVPDYDGSLSPIWLAPALVGELWFALWLLFRGRRLQELADGRGPALRDRAVAT
jgi:Domain of unknown function (DUF4386)